MDRAKRNGGIFVGKVPPLLWLSELVWLLQNNGSGANLLRGVDFGFGQGGGGLEGDHLLVAVDGEGGDAM